MTRIFPAIIMCAALSLGATACKKDKNSDHPEDQDKGDPMAELTSIPDQIQAEVDMVMQPINDVDVVIDQFTTIPTRYEVDAKSLSGMAKASLDGGEIAVEIDVASEAKAEIETMLNTVKGIGVGIEATPERVSTATANIAALAVKATGLVAKLQGQLQAKLSNPVAKADVKAKAQADLDAVIKIDTDIKALVTDAKSQVMGMPDKGVEAMAKLTAAFAEE